MDHGVIPSPLIFINWVCSRFKMNEAWMGKHQWSVINNAGVFSATGVFYTTFLKEKPSSRDRKMSNIMFCVDAMELII